MKVEKSNLKMTIKHIVNSGEGDPDGTADKLFNLIWPVIDYFQVKENQRKLLKEIIQADEGDKLYE